MIDLACLEVWFVTGSQHLYGQETLHKVEEHSTAIANALAASSHIPVTVRPKPVMTSSDSILQLCHDAKFLLVDRNTTLRNFANELRWNEIYYHCATAS